MPYIRCFTTGGWAVVRTLSQKPIYDIPGFPEVLAGDLVDNLMEQIKQFEPGFTLGERAETIEKQEDGSFIVTSNEGTISFKSGCNRRWVVLSLENH
jgi:thioredoxin reductase